MWILDTYFDRKSLENGGKIYCYMKDYAIHINWFLYFNKLFPKIGEYMTHFLSESLKNGDRIYCNMADVAMHVNFLFLNKLYPKICE